MSTLVDQILGADQRIRVPGGVRRTTRFSEWVTSATQSDITRRR